MTIEVALSEGDYVNVCEAYGGGSELLDRWRDLGDHLAHRPGWYFTVGPVPGEGTTAIWNLGAFGASLLVISVQPDGQYDCFDYEEDSNTVITDLADVEDWLSGREERARRITDLTLEGFASRNWLILREWEFDVRVDWQAGAYIASMPKLPLEATFAETIPIVIRQTQEMIVQVIGAPAELAKDLRMSMRLTPEATARLAG